MAPPLTYAPVVGVIIIVSMVIEVGKRNEKLLLMLWSEIFREKDEFPQLFQSSNIWASYRQHGWNDAREISHISLFVLMLQTGFWVQMLYVIQF